jgi:hypothetical protein
VRKESDRSLKGHALLTAGGWESCLPGRSRGEAPRTCGRGVGQSWWRRTPGFEGGGRDGDNQLHAGPRARQKQLAVRILRGGLQFLCTARLAVLLDLSLRDVLMVRTNHPEVGSRGVLAAGHGAELTGWLATRPAAEREAPSAAMAATERGIERRACTLYHLALDDSTELTYEGLD